MGEDQYAQLKAENKKIIDQLYQEAMEVYNDYSRPQEDVDVAFKKVTDKLAELGFDVEAMQAAMGQQANPVGSFNDFIETIKGKITSEEAEQLTKLANDAMATQDDQEFDAITDEMNKILGKLGVDAKEVINQYFNNNEQLGLYNVRNGKIAFEAMNTKLDSEETMKTDATHQKVWNHIVKILPKSIMDRVVKFEVNTDGQAGVMAHVVQETPDLAKWRLAVDLKDSINEDGSFNEEFTNTIIHEMFHIATLNKDQMDQGTPDKSQLVLQEGTLSKNSYLDKFYQKFWLAIKDEHQAEVDKQGGDSNQADMYGFYEKYASQFVSDYAATNVAEDVAETFRVFVIEPKPTGDDIKDQKVRFFYEFPELVKIRDDIRRSLNL